MSFIRDSLDRLLATCEERVRISQALQNQAHDMIRRSQQCILTSQEILGNSARVEAQASPKALPLATSTSRPAPQAPPQLMEVISGQILENQVVEMDGRHFVDCELIDCVLDTAAIHLYSNPHTSAAAASASKGSPRLH